MQTTLRIEDEVFRELVSEDLGHGQAYLGVRVENPFAA